MSGALRRLRLERPAATLVAVGRRPELWGEVVRLAWMAAERRPPARRPTGLWPSERYLAFRGEAMLGDGQRGLRPEEVVAYLAWCQRMRRLRR